MINLCLVTPVWVINCVLLFNFVRLLPAHSFWILFFILSGLSDAVVVSWDCFDWCCTCDGFYYVFILFCVADCCAERRILSVFPYFLSSHSSYFINHRSVTQNKKNDSTVCFFTDIYLLVICMFFLKSIAFLWRANRTQGRGVSSHWHFIIV